MSGNHSNDDSIYSHYQGEIMKDPVDEVVGENTNFMIQDAGPRRLMEFQATHDTDVIRLGCDEEMASKVAAVLARESNLQT